MPTREDVIHDILAKKELSRVEHSFAAALLEEELRKNRKLAQQLDQLSTRSASYKGLIKAVRAVLRRNVGLYEGKPEHQEALLAELRQARDPEQRKDIILHLLSTHASTRERLQWYEEVYAKIFAATGTPQTVLDIGCGLNPLSFPSRDAAYTGVDIDRTACALVEDYFSIAGIEGRCRIVDVRGIEQIKKLPRADVALVFKLLELIEQKGHKLSERLIQALPAEWIVVSFPTVTSSGAPMRSPRRPWFEKMLQRLGYRHTRFRIPNELFYIVRKQ
jgi:16S rRNA (guanine(1405)-N(7))-methyltransferase